MLKAMLTILEAGICINPVSNLYVLQAARDNEQEQRAARFQAVMSRHHERIQVRRRIDASQLSRQSL